MIRKGIRILDKVNRVVSVELRDILEEIENGKDFHWTILELEMTPMPDAGINIPQFEKHIWTAERGLFISWEELNVLAHKIFQTIWITLLGCKDPHLLRRYVEDQEMYETCDIFIQMFDSSFWEVFSKEEAWIHRLAAKFKDIKFLDSDFQKNYT